MPSARDAQVQIAEPEPGPLCSVEHFVLLLVALRRPWPRLHYTFPAFAAFCRGEALAADALAALASELPRLDASLADLSVALLAELRDPDGAEAEATYQLAHYRGRTFDRRQIVPTTDETRPELLARLGAPNARTLDEVFRPILGRLLDLTRAALAASKPLGQAPRPAHAPPNA